MTLGEKIKKARKIAGISAEDMAKQLGVSKSTIYRYEDSSIEKIPIHAVEEMCKILGITMSELMNNEDCEPAKTSLPTEFKNAGEAMEFVLRIPTLAAFGDYNPDEMEDETIFAFAYDILNQLKIVSEKYKK